MSLFGLNGNDVAKNRESRTMALIEKEINGIIKEVDKFFKENPLESEKTFMLEEESIVKKLPKKAELVFEKKKISPKEDRLEDGILYYELSDGKLIFFLKAYEKE